MKIKKLLLITFLLLGVLASACKKDDDDSDDVVTDDPRIRTMTISSLSTTFVINDVEGLIYNYDSLSYNTNVTALHPVFTGYGGTLTFQYKLSEDGEWLEYTNLDTVPKIDFLPSSTVFFKAIAPDPKYTKEYKIDVRVHEYDVEAFTWEQKTNALPVQGKVVSQKAVFYNQKYYFFYRNDSGRSYLITSAVDNEDNWIEAGEIDIENPDWTTLTTMFDSQTLVVQAGGTLYTCDLAAGGNITFTLSQAPLPENFTLQVPLFTIGNNFWIIAKQQDQPFLCFLANGSTEYQVGMELNDENLPLKDITTLVAPSGSTSIGYIFGGEDANEKGSVWAVDVSGNIIEMSSNQSAFSFRSYPMPIFFGDKLSIAGGITSTGYTNEFYDSPDSGVTWTNDTHKTLPSEIGPMAKGTIIEYARNKVILIGGENSDGFLPNVWTGILNQDILDATIY